MGQQETALMLKRASASRSSGEWNDDDFDVLADGVVVGRIFKANAAAVGSPWMWTLAFGHREGRTPTRSYAESREAAMARQELAARWDDCAALGTVERLRRPSRLLSRGGRCRQ